MTVLHGNSGSVAVNGNAILAVILYSDELQKRRDWVVDVAKAKGE